MQLRPVSKVVVFVDAPLSTDITSDPIFVGESADHSLWVSAEGTAVDATFSVLCGPDQRPESFALPASGATLELNAAGAAIVKLSLPVTRFIMIAVSGTADSVSATIQQA